MVHDHCYRMILAYEGSDFCGWEKQAQGERTVRGLLEERLQRVTGEMISVASAGRTDSGVHALGQVVTFTITKPWQPQDLLRALNANLPRDLRVLKTSIQAADFHARFSVRYKTYFYQIYESPFDMPFRRRFFHRMRKLPPLDKIRSASAFLVGEHDFAAMKAAGSDVDSTQRRIRSIKVRGGKDWARVYFTGDGFLYKMVRNMISLIINQATGTLSEREAKEIFASGDRNLAPATFPAKGLFLWRVFY